MFHHAFLLLLTELNFGHLFIFVNTVGSYMCTEVTGACPGFLKGGGPIFLGSLKKGHQILKGGGSNGLKGGGPVHLSHYDDKSCIFRC